MDTYIQCVFCTCIFLQSNGLVSPLQASIYIIYIYVYIYICVGSIRSVQIPHLTPYPIWLPLGASEHPVASEHETKSSIACPLLCITPGLAAALSYRALPHRGGAPDRRLGPRPMGGAGGEGGGLGPSSSSSPRGGPSGHIAHIGARHQQTLSLMANQACT